MAIAPNNETASSPRRVKVLTFAVTEALAERLLWWSNFALVVGAVGVLIGTIGAIAMTSAKEQFVNERISANELATQRAREGAAQANARAVEAQLALEKFKAPRLLTLERQARISSRLKPFAGTPFDVAVGPMGDPEPVVLATAILSTLTNAGWHQIEWKTRDAQLLLTEPGKPNFGAAAVTNVIVDIHPAQAERLWSIAKALEAVLVAEGIDAQAQQGSGGRNTNENAIHIMIGRKM
jgi:hypothetical protein